MGLEFDCAGLKVGDMNWFGDMVLKVGKLIHGSGVEFRDSTHGSSSNAGSPTYTQIASSFSHRNPRSKGPLCSEALTRLVFKANQKIIPGGTRSHVPHNLLVCKTLSYLPQG